MFDFEFFFVREDIERSEYPDPGVIADGVPTPSGDPAAAGGDDTGATPAGSADDSPPDLGGGEVVPPTLESEVALDLSAFEALLPGAGFNFDFGLFF